eukprot:15247683-Alexandrium_andersonii.AAC.1
MCIRDSAAGPVSASLHGASGGPTPPLRPTERRRRRSPPWPKDTSQRSARPPSLQVTWSAGNPALHSA